MKLKFRAIFLMAGLIPIFVGACIIGIFSMRLVNKEVRETEFEKLQATATNLSEYFAYDIRNNGEVDYDEYSDHAYVNLLTDMDIQQTLFKEDVRFLTSIKKEDGSYDEGSIAKDGIWETVKKGEDYTSENVKIDGKNYFVYYTPVYADEAQTQVWGMAFAGIPSSEVERITSEVRTQVFVISAILMVVFTIILFVLSMMVTKTLRNVKKDVESLADGEISEEKGARSFCREFDDIAMAVAKLQMQLNDTISSIKNTSSELGDSAKSVDELSVTSANGADQITEAVNQLATTAQSMAESVQEANEAVVNMGNSIESITESTSGVSNKAILMKNDNEKSLKDMKNVYQSNENSVEAISRINEQTQACTAAAYNIRDAAAMISDIAGQTNLLALNASIEAARAGESGRGFAVVAENIRILAEQSDASVKEIENAVNDVVTKVQTCAEMANDAKNLMQEQQRLVREVSNGMEELSGNVAEVAKEIELVNQEVDALDNAKNSVLGNISDLSAISEENAASAEEVTATIETVAVGIAGTKHESGQMLGMADVLKDKIKFFK